MEKHIVYFHMVNGDKLKHELEIGSPKDVLNMLNTSSDWLDFETKGETHYICSSKVVSVKIVSQSLKDKRAEEKMDQMNSLKF